MEEIKNTSQILEAILHFYHINARNFAEKIGTSPTQIYDLRKGKIRKLSPEMTEKILSAYPQISRSFLLTGEGDLFGTQSAPSINTISQNGDNVQNNGVNEESISKMLETIHSQQQTIQSLVEMLSKKD